MGTYFHRWVIILLLALVGVGIFGSGEVYAGGGSFNVPQVNDHFDKVKEGPAPKKEESMTPNTKEEEGLWDWITEPVSSAWDWTVDTVSSAWDWTVDTVSSAWDWTVNAVSSAWDWTVDAVSTAWDWTVDTVSSAWDWTVNAVSSAWDWTVDTVSGVWDWLSGILAKITEIVIEDVEFIVGAAVLVAAVAIKWAAPDFGNRLMNWGKKLVGVDTSHPHGRLKDVKVSDKTLAEASHIVYFIDKLTDRQIEDRLGKGWVVERDPITKEIDPKTKIDLPNGLQAILFKNPDTKEIIIVFRGTEPKFNDLVIADGPIALGLDSINPQAQSARAFVEGLLNNPKYQGYQFVLTGHSLGGYLAVDSGAKYKIPTVTFNAAGKNLFPSVNASTVLATVLFGPEAGPVATAATYTVNMLDPDNRKQAINEALGNYDDLIRNYNYDHDLVGGVNYRPGETYVIDEQGKVTENEGLDNDLLNMNLDAGTTHTVRNFTGKEDNGDPYPSPVPGTYDDKGNIVPR